MKATSTAPIKGYLDQLMHLRDEILLGTLPVCLAEPMRSKHSRVVILTKSYMFMEAPR